MGLKYAEIIVDVPIKTLDKIFHYTIPSQLEGKVQIGSRVFVPFGNRQVEGYIVGFSNQADVERLKPISKIIGNKPAFGEDILALAKWMSDRYFCSFIAALNCVVPPFTKKVKAKTKSIVALGKRPPEILDYIKEISVKAPKQAAVLEKALLDCRYGIEEIAAVADTTRSTVQTLIHKGFLKVEEEEVYRDPCQNRSYRVSTPLKPTEEQQQALNTILHGLETQQQLTFLVHGVTGSGKTEIYLQVIAKVLEQNKQVIVLVPEISLTPQMVDRFKSRFGDAVAVLHSRLSQGERFDEWNKISRQEAKIVVGARSAIFAPFGNLGLIIIDEEHESSYKQEENPKYHARDVAIKRAQLAKAMVILGSATPSLEAYLKAQEGEYRLISLQQRVENRPLPQVKICDLREELKEGHKSIFSRSLLTKIKERIDRGEQIILFLNRRGYSTFVMCRECGLVLKCPSCSIPLTYHATDFSLHCHYCEFKRSTPQTCPKCSSKYIKFFGIGTQKIEEEFKKLFPEVKVLRMDVDTTGRKGSHEKILGAFQRLQAQVLIGTQMIAKGLDFPNVTLVGVITSDTSLNLPDFRAAEKTFQLLTQVAGRAGRHSKPGEVIIQTYNPEHYSIEAACQQDYPAFYKQEIEIRKVRDYPPFSNLVRILISHQNEQLVIDEALHLGNILNSLIREYDGVEVLGPAQAPIEKIKNRHRWQVILKGKERSTLMKVLSNSYQELARYNSNIKAGISIDVDPQGML